MAISTVLLVDNLVRCTTNGRLGYVFVSFCQGLQIELLDRLPNIIAHATLSPVFQEIEWVEMNNFVKYNIKYGLKAVRTISNTI